MSGPITDYEERIRREGKEVAERSFAKIMAVLLYSVAPDTWITLDEQRYTAGDILLERIENEQGTQFRARKASPELLAQLTRKERGE